MNKTILALDVFDFKKAEKLVKDLSPYIDIFKVGPILFLQSGKEIIKMINDNGKKVFLDLSFTIFRQPFKERYNQQEIWAFTV